MEDMIVWINFPTVIISVSPDTMYSTLYDGTIYINSAGIPKDDKNIHDSYG